MSSDTCAGCKQPEKEADEEQDEKKKKILHLVYLLMGSLLLLTGFILEKSDHTYKDFSWSLFSAPGFLSSGLYCAFILYTIGYTFLLSNLIKRAIDGFKEHEFINEVTLMIVATAGAYAIGEFPESLFVILFSIIGEMLEDKAVEKSSASIKKLINSMPLYAHLIAADGSVYEGNPKELKAGDIIEIRPGEKIPVDGIIVRGEASLDLSSLNGESLPHFSKVGDAVYSGAVCLDALLRIKATKPYADSTLTKIMNLVESEQSKKAHSEKFITGFSKIYTPLVLLIALLTFLIGFGLSHWSFAQGGKVWLYRACSVLLISCPCALVISAPVSFFFGIGAASKLGILLKGSLAVENMAKAKTFVFDKTGTLTKGNFALINHPEEKCLRIAASLERKSTHPLAKAIVDAYPGVYDEVDSFSLLPGKGAEGIIQGEHYFIGSLDHLQNQGIDVHPENSLYKALYLASLTHKTCLASFLVADEIKEEASASILALKKEGMKKSVMLSGDDAKIADEVSKAIGLDEGKGNLLPSEKLAAVKALAEKSTIAYVGDGVNDSPSLLSSHVGISMGALGSDAAIEASDVVIMDDDLLKVAEAKRLSKRTMRIVRACIFLSLLIKAIIFILVVGGALGDYSMTIASLADTGVLSLALLVASLALHYHPKYLKNSRA